MKRIGIFGGTFDPPHLGHLNMAKLAYEELNLDKVWFIPNKIPAYKLKEHGISSEEDRLNMLKLMLEEESSWCEIKLYELLREGNTYTSDTLIFLQNEFKDTEFYLIIGSDSFKNIKIWHEPENVFKNATIVVLLRDNASIEELENISLEYKNKYEARIYLINNNKINISSTDIRRRIKDKESVDNMIIKREYEYIVENNIYFDL